MKNEKKLPSYTFNNNAAIVCGVIQNDMEKTIEFAISRLKESYYNGTNDEMVRSISINGDNVTGEYGSDVEGFGYVHILFFDIGGKGHYIAELLK